MEGDQQLYSGAHTDKVTLFLGPLPLACFACPVKSACVKSVGPAMVPLIFGKKPCGPLTILTPAHALALTSAPLHRAIVWAIMFTAQAVL